MDKKFFKAFTMGETLITLSLIGILAITMLSLNDLSGNDTKIATAKLTQLDSALQAWGKAVTASNETGLGASQAFNDTGDLSASLTEFLNTQGITNNDVSVTANNETYTSGNQIQISKDLVLEVAYTGGSASKTSNGSEFNSNLSESSIAVLTATASSKKATLSNEYALTKTGLENLDSLYEGWDKYLIETVTTSDGDKRMYCPGLDSCKDGCTLTNGCIETNIENTYIYVKTDSVVACGSGQTGTITTRKIGAGTTVYDEVIDTCCPSPKVYSGLDENGKKLCSCPSTFVPDNGYERNDSSLTCQTPCQPGQFEVNHECKLCTTNHYCPSEKMTAATECEAGYYCPNDKTEKDTTKYNEKKYVDFDKTNNTSDIANGGLINKVKCPVGNYCSSTGMDAPTICPKGYYCPQEGLVQPIPCPAGTYGDKLGATAKSACKPCEDGKYQDQVGQTSCKPCANGATPSADKTSCEICQAGTYFDGNKCQPCPKGHKCPTAGMTSPTACTCGTYQPQEGKTECYDVPVGAYPTSNNTYVKSAATTATICPAGYTCQGGCNDKVPCTPQYYQDLTGQNYCKDCPKGHKCPDIAMEEPTDCTPGYYQDETKQIECKDCPEGHKCPNSEMEEPTACPCGTYQNETKKTSCKNVTAGHYPTKGNRANLGSGATGIGTCTAGSYCIGGCNLSQPCSGNTYSHAGYAYCPACPNVSWKLFAASFSGSTNANANHTSCTCGHYLFYYDGFGGNITLSGTSSVGDTFSCPAYVHNTDPVILDLKDNGIKLTSVENGIIFDVLGTGHKVKTAWTDVQTEFDDAFLCQDINGNGKIDDGTELFGDQNGAENGLKELAKYDDNNDGVINQEDAIFERLLLWVDFNKNGITDEGEIKSIKEENITEVSTSYKIEVDENGKVKVDENGNQVGVVGTFKKLLEDGTEAIGKLIDAFFKIIDRLFN